MKLLGWALIASLGTTACAEGPLERVSPTKASVSTSNAEEQGKPVVEAPTPVQAPVQTPVVQNPVTVTTPSQEKPPMKVEVQNGPSIAEILAGLKFEAHGLPSGESDLYDFDLKIVAEPSVSHFSYKIGSPDDCKVAGGYRVEPVSSVIRATVSNLPDGLVAVCLLRYLASGEGFWQKAEQATVVSWKKAPFVRTIKSQFEEYDTACRKNLITQTVIKFNGNDATYTWVRDARSQGCKGVALAQGEDRLTITSSTATEIKGFWNYEGQTASGWYSFKWSNPERSKFQGVFGYGDPSLEPTGPWVSVEP